MNTTEPPARTLPEVAILHEEGPLLVVNKPGGLLTQGPPGIDSLELRIKQFLIIRENKPGKAYLGVPHRLDRPASGVMVFAKHVRAARRLAEQFEGRLVEKKYWAVVEGNVAEDAGTWTDYLRKIPDQPRAEIVQFGDDDAREAVLHFQVLARFEASTLLEITLETGRMHQVRLQGASRGHAVLGDEMYGSRTPFGPQTEDLRERWIALHARKISLRHPMTQEKLSITAPLPAAWKEIEERLSEQTSSAELSNEAPS